MKSALEGLLAFARAKGLLAEEDVCFARNMLLSALGLSAPPKCAEAAPLPETATGMLASLCDIAAKNGVLVDEPFEREQFAAHLMSLLTPPPSQVAARFAALSAAKGIVAATDWYYALCRANDYIRVDEIAKNVRFEAASPYGELEITINLSKPEKDPREIAKALRAPQQGYPACMLCVENEGYVGRPGYPSHETLRMIPIAPEGEPWFFQFSPYSYYEEHCIALNSAHIPMSISPRALSLLLTLTDQFPHYFFGSNADLPIVGGSILTHDHFQGGRHVFPMDKAPAYAAFGHPDYPDVCMEAVRWPMTCIRLTARDRGQLLPLASALLAAWRGYDDAPHDIVHETDGEPHNTVTPIARRDAEGRYQLSLVLRNNRTSAEHPLGIFHPHAALHHIKRENIGLIEVMGLFILPGRLRAELSQLSEYLTGERPLRPPKEGDPLRQHFAWIEALARAHGTALSKGEAEQALRGALAAKCVKVLEDAGVYKPHTGDAALAAFLETIGARPL